MKKLLTNSKSNFARNLGLALVIIVPIICATSCKKKESPCTDYTNPECPNYDPCYGIADIYSSKQAAEQNAANNVRSTYQAIQGTGFASSWNVAFPYNMNAHLDSTGSTTPNIKDTAIVSEKMCRGYLQTLGNNPTFMSEVGPSMYGNITADSTYVITEQDKVNYYQQNQSCIDN